MYHPSTTVMHKIDTSKHMAWNITHFEDTQETMYLDRGYLCWADPN